MQVAGRRDPGETNQSRGENQPMKGEVRTRNIHMIKNTKTMTVNKGKWGCEGLDPSHFIMLSL